MLNAYAEVETILAAEKYLDGRVEHLDRASTHALAALNLAGDRYRSGLDDYITVLESQRRSLSTLVRLLELRRLRLENRVDLYLALGGGFEVPVKEGTETVAMTDESEKEAGIPR